MSATAVWHFILWIHYIALAVWIGGITFLSVISAPAIHQSMASRALAGNIVGKMLKRFNRIEIACCIGLVCTSLASTRFARTEDSMLCYLLLAVVFMGLVTGYYAYSITPRMDALKEKIPTIDALSPTHTAKLEFDRLHRIYVKLMSLNLAIGLMVLYGSVVLFQ